MDLHSLWICLGLSRSLSFPSEEELDLWHGFRGPIATQREMGKEREERKKGREGEREGRGRGGEGRGGEKGRRDDGS